MLTMSMAENLEDGNLTIAISNLLLDDVRAKLNSLRIAKKIRKANLFYKFIGGRLFA